MLLGAYVARHLIVWPFRYHILVTSYGSLSRTVDIPDLLLKTMKFNTVHVIVPNISLNQNSDIC